MAGPMRNRQKRNTRSVLKKNPEWTINNEQSHFWISNGKIKMMNTRNEFFFVYGLQSPSPRRKIIIREIVIEQFIMCCHQAYCYLINLSFINGYWQQSVLIPQSENYSVQLYNNHVQYTWCHSSLAHWLELLFEIESKMAKKRVNKRNKYYYSITACVMNRKQADCVSPLNGLSDDFRLMM